MWKYQCKKHLGWLLGAAVFGAIMFGWLYADYANEVIKQAAEMAKQPEILEMKFLPFFVGALLGASAANGLLLTTYALQRFNLSFFFMYLIIFALFSVMVVVGMVLLLPAIGVCVYGWLSIPNRGRRNDLRKNAVSSVAEVERVYRLHHTYHEEYEEMAKKAWDYTLRMNLLYIISILAIFVVIMWINDMIVMMLAFVIYALTFFQLSRRKALAVQPIISLLYDQCDPEACASAIFALAKKSRKKKSFPLPQYLAQCMIYLNDPHLAADVMVTCERNKNAMMFPYYSVMSYAYYQLGDESMVKFQLDECEKSSVRMQNGPMGLMRTQCIQGIQNKLDLMNQDFGKTRTYYEEALKTSIYEFQKVDSHYYLGLIAFVNRDFEEAENHFRYVNNHGSKMYFVEKAVGFLKTIEAAQPKEDSEA
ncbi:hypothetical protein [Amedibacillus sp. YH-ame10]